MLEDLNVKWEEGKISQICEVVYDAQKRVEYYWEKMGFGPWYFWDMETPELREVYYHGVRVEKVGFRCVIAQIGPIQYEIVQPLYGKSIYVDFLETKGEGFHHNKIYYKDVDKAIEYYKSKDIYVIQQGKYRKDQHAYFNTDKELGLTWEIGNNEDIGDPMWVYPKK